MGISKDGAVDRKNPEDHSIIQRQGGEIFKSLGEDLPVGLFRTTPDESGKLLAANQTFLRLLGYTHLAEISRIDAISPHLRDNTWQSLCAQLSEAGSVANIEMEFVKKDGSRLWGAVTARSIKAEANNAAKYFDCALEDITERKQAEDTLRQRADELASLHAISLDITSAHAFSELTEIIVRQATRLLKVEFACLFLCDVEKPELWVAAQSEPVYMQATSGVIPFGKGVAGTVALDGKALLVDDYLKWHGEVSEFEKSYCKKSLLSVPLIWQGRVTGVLQVSSDRETRRFDQKDLELLILFANQVAIALENSRLLEAQRSQLLLTRTLQEVGALLTSQLSLDEVLESILELLKRVVKYDSASIQLLDEEGRFQLSAGRGFEDLARTSQVIREFGFQMLHAKLAEQNLIVVPRTSLHAGWVPTPGSEHIKSWIGAALKVKGRFIGTLNIDSRTENAYDPATGETVLAFAHQAAVAIENARLFELEETRVAQLENLRQASLSLTARLELSAVLNAILESTLRLMPSASNGHIFLYSEDNGGQLTFGAALWSGGRRGKPFSNPRPEGLTYTVARSGQPVLVRDMQAHSLYTNAPKSWKGTIIGLPLMIGTRVVGVMNVSKERPDAFSRSDLGLLRLLGDQAAIAIENARLYEQAAMERRHLGLLYDIGRELAPSLDKDDILRRAITLACQALGGSSGKAFLYHSEQKRLSLRANYPDNGKQLDEYPEEINFTLGFGVSGWVAEHCQPVNLPDVTQDQRWLVIPGIDEQVRSLMSAPILHQKRLLGVFSMLHPSVGAYSQDHLDLLQAICQQVGLALSTVERYQEVQHLVDLLAAEQNRLKSLVEHLPVGVLLLDSEFRLVLANSIGREIHSTLESGKSEERLTKIGPIPLEKLVAQSNDPLPMDVVLNEPVKKVLELQTRQLEGELPQWVVMIQDVTQERQNQTRIQMQERLATVGQLAAGIAHDFNNIMAAILVYTDLLRRDLELYPTASDRLAIIQQQVQRAASLIRQILDFSRRSVMEQSQLDLLPFIKELDKLLARILPETIRLDLVYQPDAYLVNADPIRLQQVFMNLAVNSRDAMPTGGILRFELSRLELAPGESPPVPYLPPGDWVVIHLSDTGSGISPEELPHIFEPFFTTKPVGQGTGLGLAQAYGIVKQHDGYIEVRSQLDEGTCFSIYLPALPYPEISSVPSEDGQDFDGDGELILVVEDDTITRDAIRDLLEVQNYRVLTAANGVEAIQIYENYAESIALLISDIVMPEVGGVALYHQLKERYPQLKILFVTGHPLQDENLAVLVDSGISWLEKPFTVPDFSQAVKALLESG